MTEPLEHDTSWYIFEPRFLAKVPTIALYTEEETRLHGTPSTGYRQHDVGIRNDMTNAYLPIATLASISHVGHYVGVAQESDCKTIYEYVQNHLTAWAKRLGEGLNRPTGPFEDLLILDDFAQRVYAHARHQYYDASNSLSPFLQQLENLGMLSEFSIFRPSLQVRADLGHPTAAATTPAGPGKRAPLSDIFQAALLR